MLFMVSIHVKFNLIKFSHSLKVVLTSLVSLNFAASEEEALGPCEPKDMLALNLSYDNSTFPTGIKANETFSSDLNGIAPSQF